MLVQVCGLVASILCYKSPFAQYHIVKSKNNLASIFTVLDMFSQ